MCKVQISITMFSLSMFLFIILLIKAGQILASPDLIKEEPISVANIIEVTHDPLTTFSDKISSLSLCLDTYSESFNVCQNCTQLFIEIETLREDLEGSSLQEGIDIKAYDLVKKEWDEMQCSSCMIIKGSEYQWTDSAKQFLLKWQKVAQCFEQYADELKYCTKCENAYLAIRQFYYQKKLECFDIDERVTDLKESWKPCENEYIIPIVTSLLLVFIIGAGCWIYFTYKNLNLEIMKRKPLCIRRLSTVAEDFTTDNSSNFQDMSDVPETFEMGDLQSLQHTFEVPKTMIQRNLPAPQVKAAKNFEFLKWSAVATWGWDVQVENCAICRNHLMSDCVDCQATQINLHAETEECNIAWGTCNHAFHCHCISRWLKDRNQCPLDNKLWDLARVGKQ